MEIGSEIDARTLTGVPLIVGYHLIFAAYGFWLPNDPRGSWSDFVGSWDLLRYGVATKTDERHSVAHREHDQVLRKAAKSDLRYPPVVFNGLQARAIARGFAQYSQRCDLPVWACAILPDHVHLVVGRPRISAEQIVLHLKAAATKQLELEGIHPLANWKQPGGRSPKAFARGQWKVFLEPDDVPRAIRYVQANPLKEGKKRQTWSFLTAYQ
jgi:REP element-mobilizing transposase RayT